MGDDQKDARIRWNMPPNCPRCGAPMLDDRDGMTGSWFCANNHRAVLVSFPTSDADG